MARTEELEGLKTGTYNHALGLWGGKKKKRVKKGKKRKIGSTSWLREKKSQWPGCTPGPLSLDLWVWGPGMASLRVSQGFQGFQSGVKVDDRRGSPAYEGGTLCSLEIKVLIQFYGKLNSFPRIFVERPQDANCSRSCILKSNEPSLCSGIRQDRPSTAGGVACISQIDQHHRSHYFWELVKYVELGMHIYGSQKY